MFRIALWSGFYIGREIRVVSKITPRHSQRDPRQEWLMSTGHRNSTSPGAPDDRPAPHRHERTAGWVKAKIGLCFGHV
jgi:hypothetical protein